MSRRFNQHRVREIAAVLRKHARDGKRISVVTANEAADMLEDAAMVVYGIQEKFPVTEDTASLDNYDPGKML